MHSNLLYPFTSMTIHRSPTGKDYVARFRATCNGNLVDRTLVNIAEAMTQFVRLDI